jgi:opacity protein-like surface antigen
MPYAQNVSFGVEREVARNWAVGAGYIYVHGVHLLRSANLNLGPPVVLTAGNAAALGVASPTPQQLGRNYYGAAVRPNANFTNIQYVTAGGNSAYNGLQLSLQKRFSHGFQARANYTFAKAIDDSSDFTQAQQPQDPVNPRAERSLSLEDQRSRLTLTGVWDLPYTAKTMSWLLGGWVLSTNWNYRSGTPRNVTIGSDVNLDGQSNDRPFNGQYLLGRNTWTGPESFVVDARISKRFRIRERYGLRILAETFNLENRVNYSGVNTTWGTALAARTTLGLFTSANSPRQVEFGVKLEF